ncbi:MAG: TlpA disulfide reductase family protein [Chitinophagaceae bacterium]
MIFPVCNLEYYNLKISKLLRQLMIGRASICNKLNPSMIKNSIIIILLLIGPTGCNNSPVEKPASTTQVMGEIDKIRLTDLKGQSIDLKTYQGKTIFINFWATWCKPCVQEMPSIVGAQNILQKENIIFLLASDESAQQIEEFSSTGKFKFKYVKIENSEEMKVQALPTTFIYNKKGNLVFSETGARKWDEKKNIDMIIKISQEND